MPSRSAAPDRAGRFPGQPARRSRSVRSTRGWRARPPHRLVHDGHRVVPVDHRQSRHRHCGRSVRHACHRIRTRVRPPQLQRQQVAEVPPLRRCRRSGARTWPPIPGHSHAAVNDEFGSLGAGDAKHPRHDHVDAPRQRVRNGQETPSHRGRLRCSAAAGGLLFESFVVRVPSKSMPTIAGITISTAELTTAMSATLKIGQYGTAMKSTTWPCNPLEPEDPICQVAERTADHPTHRQRPPD